MSHTQLDPRLDQFVWIRAHDMLDLRIISVSSPFTPNSVQMMKGLLQSLCICCHFLRGSKVPTCKRCKIEYNRIIANCCIEVGLSHHNPCQSWQFELHFLPVLLRCIVKNGPHRRLFAWCPNYSNINLCLSQHCTEIVIDLFCVCRKQTLYDCCQNLDSIPCLLLLFVTPVDICVQFMVVSSISLLPAGAPRVTFRFKTFRHSPAWAILNHFNAVYRPVVLQVGCVAVSEFWVTLPFWLQALLRIIVFGLPLLPSHKGRTWE